MVNRPSGSTSTSLPRKYQRISSVLEALKNKNQTENAAIGFDDFFLPIIKGNADDSHKSNGAWPWNGQTSKACGLVDGGLGFKFYKNDGTTIVPMQEVTFAEAAKHLRVTESDCQPPTKWEDYVAQTDAPTFTTKDKASKFAFHADPYWKDYERFYNDIPVEYEAFKENFKGCVYDKGSYKSWYDAQS